MVDEVKKHFENYINVGGEVHRRLFSSRQHGYRRRLSCCTNILQLMDDILSDTMEGAEVALLMCDLSAADTVPHQLLLGKLALYGAL